MVDYLRLVASRGDSAFIHFIYSRAQSPCCSKKQFVVLAA
jgi:hypothetical protein